MCVCMSMCVSITCCSVCICLRWLYKVVTDFQELFLSGNCNLTHTQEGGRREMISYYSIMPFESSKSIIFKAIKHSTTSGLWQ